MTSPPAPAAQPSVAESATEAGHSTAEAAAVEQTLFGWTPGDRWFFAVVGVVLLISVSVYALRMSGWGVTAIPVDRPEDRKYEFQLDVNTASWVEWMQLEGIGESLARRIVADRAQRGPFQSVEDVNRVNGIGPAKLAAIRPWLRFDERTAGPSGATASTPSDIPD